MKLKYVIYFLLFIGLGYFIYYRISENAKLQDKGKDKNAAGKAMQLLGIVAKSASYDNVIELSGSVDANEEVEIRSEISGIVNTIYFKEGATVTKGQTLFKVNDAELQAQLIQAKTKQNLASENERRAKLLLQKEAISQEEYDASMAEFRSMKAQTQLIQAQMAKTLVRAPFSGRVGLRMISPGTYVTPTTPITNLVNTSKLKITFAIPEKYASEIKNNTIITFTTSGNNEIFNATVYATEPMVNETTRTLQVRALADNTSGKLKAGVYANVKLPLEQIKDAILVPSEAIIPIQNGKKIFITENGKAKEVKVETATRTNSDILVLSGINVGDTIITSGVMSLKPETPVTIKVKK
jgi:membrane fusion protein (multidrug efflux system)